MARVVVERVVSDLSGAEIPEGTGWVMTLTPPDGRRNPVRLDVTEDEALQWLALGTEVKRRGRPPGSSRTPKAIARKAATNGRRKRTAKTKTTRRRRTRRASTT